MFSARGFCARDAHWPLLRWTDVDGWAVGRVDWEEKTTGVTLLDSLGVQRTHVSGVNRVQRCQSGVYITCCVIKLEEREMKSYYSSVLKLTEPQVRPNATNALRISKYSECCFDAAAEIRNYYSFIWITVWLTSTCSCLISIPKGQSVVWLLDMKNARFTYRSLRIDVVSVWRQRQTQDVWGAGAKILKGNPRQHFVMFYVPNEPPKGPWPTFFSDLLPVTCLTGVLLSLSVILVINCLDCKMSIHVSTSPRQCPINVMLSSVCG